MNFVSYKNIVFLKVCWLDSFVNYINSILCVTEIQSSALND